MGVQVAGMTYDDRSVLADFHQSERLGFPLLQDQETKHVDAYGVKNTEYEPGHQGYGIPYPGILYIQSDGVVALKFAVPGYRERPPLTEVYEAIKTGFALAD